MGLFDRLSKRNMHNADNASMVENNSHAALNEDSVEKAIAERVHSIRLEDCLKVQFADIAALGTGFAECISAFRTVSQTVTVEGVGYIPVNMEAGDALKTAGKDMFYGAHKTKSGRSVMTKWKKAGTQTVASAEVMPLNPATIMIAAMLVGINEKLEGIQATQESILSFLEQDKQAEMQADCNVLTDALEGYRHNWDNSQYKTNHHIKVLDIKQTAEKNIIFYQTQIATAIEKLPAIHVDQAVNSGAKKLGELFRNYRMALYLFGFSSFMEVMLLENFREEYLNQVADKVRQYNECYRTQFLQCRGRIKSFASTSIEKQVLGGIGSASKTLGKLIADSPVLSKGPVDAWLRDSGDRLLKDQEAGAEKTAATFDAQASIGNEMFIDSIRSVETICNRTTDILFDADAIYLATA